MFFRLISSDWSPVVGVALILIGAGAVTWVAGGGR